MNAADRRQLSRRPQLAQPPLGLVTPLCSLVYAIKSVNSLTEREGEMKRKKERGGH